MKKLYPLFISKSKEELKENKFSSSLADCSLIANGFLKGNSIEEVIDTYLGSFIGDDAFEYYKGRLPFQTKKITTRKEGTALVSPSDEIAIPRWLAPGKERIFYILKAQKESTLYIGFKRDVTASELYEKMLEGKIKSLMNECEPAQGELYYIEGNVPFAIGKGVEILEISSNSQIEFDIEKYEQFTEALDFINLNKYIPLYEIPNDKNIAVDTILLTKPNTFTPSELNSLTILFVLEGKVTISGKNNEEMELSRHSLIVIPNDTDELTIAPASGNCQLLRAFIKNIPAVEPNEDEEEHHHHDHHHDHHHHHHDHDCDCENECDDDCCSNHSHNHNRILN